MPRYAVRFWWLSDAEFTLGSPKGAGLGENTHPAPTSRGLPRHVLFVKLTLGHNTRMANRSIVSGFTNG